MTEPLNFKRQRCTSWSHQPPPPLLKKDFSNLLCVDATSIMFVSKSVFRSVALSTPSCNLQAYVTNNYNKLPHGTAAMQVLEPLEEELIRF